MEKKMKVEDSPSLPPACPRGSFYTRCSLLLYVVARSLLHSAPARHFLPVPVVARNIPPTSTKTAFSSSLLIRGPCSYVSHRRHAELYLRRSLHCTTTSTTRRAKPLAHSCSWTRLILRKKEEQGPEFDNQSLLDPDPVGVFRGGHRVLELAGGTQHLSCGAGFRRACKV